VCGGVIGGWCGGGGGGCTFDSGNKTIVILQGMHMGVVWVELSITSALVIMHCKLL